MARFSGTLSTPVEPRAYLLRGAVWFLVAAANIAYLAWRDRRGLVVAGSIVVVLFVSLLALANVLPR